MKKYLLILSEKEHKKLSYLSKITRRTMKQILLKGIELQDKTNDKTAKH